MSDIKVQNIPDTVDPVALANKLLGEQGIVTSLFTLQAIYNLFTSTPLAVNVQTGTTYTLALSDNGKTIVFTNAAAVTITLPQQSNIALPVGFNCLIRTAGAGGGSIVGEGSDVLVGNTSTGTSTADAGIVLRAIASTINTFDIFGGTT